MVKRELAYIESLKAVIALKGGITGYELNELEMLTRFILKKDVEYEKQKQILEVLKKIFNENKDCIELLDYISYFSKKEEYEIRIYTNDEDDYLTRIDLTEEEFNLLKEWLK